MEHDTPFSTWPGMLRFLNGNMKRRRDNWIGIEGPEGSGKTTIGMHLALALKPTFSVEHDAIFTVNQLLDVLAAGRKGELYFLDEAANIFYNRDWSSWESKELTKLGRQMRIMQSTWIVIMPDFDGLDPYIREKRIRTRIYQPPYWDSDGMNNGVAKVLWKTERFDYNDQRVVHRWTDLFDLQVSSLDGHPAWAAYERRKETNFNGLVASIQARLRREAERDLRRFDKTNGKRKGKHDKDPAVLERPASPGRAAA